MKHVIHVCGYQLLAEKDTTPIDHQRAEQDSPRFAYYTLAGGKHAASIIICPQCGRQLKTFDLYRQDGSRLSDKL